MAKSDWGADIERALMWAVEGHRGTFRDGDAPVPYACHPVEVMLLLRHVGGVTEEAHLAASLMHDLVEDTPITLKEIEENFGAEIAGLVGEVTRDEPDNATRETLSKEDLWKLRTDLLMEEIRAMSVRAKQIKLADRLSNIREGMKTRSGYKLDRYIGQTRMILDAIDREVSPPLWDAILAELPEQ